MAICDAHRVQVIEDCAHTMGADWDGTQSGRFGVAGCYSTQTYKHMNSGEGGLIVSDDAEMMARMIMLSGSYMLYDRHIAAPDASVFTDIRYDTPNVSGRMDNLRAAILRPQLKLLDQKCAEWRARYSRVELGLRNVPGLKLIERPAKEGYVPSSFQFLMPELTDDQINSFVAANAARGVELKWFGAPEPVGFTSRHDSWRYAEAQKLPQTDRVLHGLLDMRLPLTISLDDCDLIAEIIADEARALQ